MSGERKEIAIQILNIYLHMGNGLGAIDNENDTFLMTKFGDFLNWSDKTKDVCNLGDSYDFRFFVYGGFDVFNA